MPLLKVQEELAALLMEADARKAFATDKAGTLRKRGVKGRDATLLAGLDADDLAYFATRRNIDRHQALRADAPRSVRLLEATRSRVQPYFRAFPYSLEDPVAETRRFAKWAARAAKDGSAPALLADLAAYEAAVLALSKRTWTAPRAAKHLKRLPGQVLLTLQHDLPAALKADGVPKAAPTPTWLVLQQRPDDVMWYRVEEIDHVLLRRADGKTAEGRWLAAAANEAGVSLAKATRSARELAQSDLLVAPA